MVIYQSLNASHADGKKANIKRVNCLRQVNSRDMCFLPLDLHSSFMLFF